MIDESNHDPVDDMADTLDVLYDIVERSGGTVKRSEGNRLSLLYLHALFALFISPLFMLWGFGPNAMKTTTWQVARAIPGQSTTLAALLFLGGAVLLLGTATRSPRWAGTGLMLILIWYSIIAVTFAAAIILWVLNGSPDATQPALYAPGVYAHLAAVMVIHLTTVWKMVHKGR